MEDGIELKVIPAIKKMETGLGRARMDQASRERLGLSLGDLIEIVGKKGVAAKVFKDLPAEYGEGVSTDSREPMQASEKEIPSKSTGGMWFLQ